MSKTKVVFSPTPSSDNLGLQTAPINTCRSDTLTHGLVTQTSFSLGSCPAAGFLPCPLQWLSSHWNSVMMRWFHLWLQH